MAKSSVNIELSRIPVALTYDQALTTFRNVVNSKFPPEVNNTTSRQRRVNEASRMANNGGRGQAGRLGRGRSGGRGRGGRNPHKRRGSTAGGRIIQDIEGKAMKVHASYNFTNNQWSKIPNIERDRLRKERLDIKEVANSLPLVQTVTNITSISAYLHIISRPKIVPQVLTKVSSVTFLISIASTQSPD